MAVGRLTLARILETLLTEFPDGVVRRDLLDFFASTMVSSRASRGAKGRLALRLYRYLGKLLRKAALTMDAGIIRLPARIPNHPPCDLPPLLTTDLRKLLFLAMMAEDRNPDPGPNLRVITTRRAYLDAALAAGFSAAEAGAELGLSGAVVVQFLSPALTGHQSPTKEFAGDGQ